MDVAKSLCILWMLCSAFTALTLPPFIYVPTPLSYGEATQYCQSMYGTDLAKIVTDGDVQNVKDFLGNHNTELWANLEETETTDPLQCKFMDFTFESSSQARRCSTMPLDPAVSDCSTKRPFLCTQQLDYVMGSGVTAPGETYTVPGGVGTIKISEKAKYLHHAHTLSCSIDVDIDGKVLPTSYIEVSTVMSSAVTLDVGSILLVTEPMFNLLPFECVTEPALKVISVNPLESSVKLFVEEVMLMEYITEMDVNAADLQVLTVPAKADTVKIDGEQIFKDNGIKDGVVGIATLKCAVYDENGVVDGKYTEPIDGICHGNSAYDAFKNPWGDGFNMVSVTRRRRLGFFSFFRNTFKRVESKVNTAVGVVKGFVTNTVVPVVKIVADNVEKTVETAVDTTLATGRIIVALITEKGFNERVYKGGVYIDTTTQFLLQGQKDKELYDNGLNDDKKKWSLSVFGSFKVQAGVDLAFECTADIAAKYKLFTSLSSPRFDHFKFVITGTNTFKSYVNVVVDGGVSIKYTLFKKEVNVMVKLGIFPIKMKLYADVSMGLDASLSITLGKTFGYKPLFMKFGVEYAGGSWNKIQDYNFAIKPDNSMGGEVVDAKSCISMNIKPYIRLTLGIVFYEVVDFSVALTAAFPAALTWPATCDSTAACDQTETQLKFNINAEFVIGGSIDVGASDLGWSVSVFSWEAYRKSWLLLEHCSTLTIDLLKDFCCAKGILYEESTPQQQAPAVCHSVWTAAVGTVATAECPATETMVSCGGVDKLVMHTDTSSFNDGSKILDDGRCQVKTYSSDSSRWPELHAVATCCKYVVDPVEAITVTSEKGNDVTASCPVTHTLTGCNVHWDYDPDFAGDMRTAIHGSYASYEGLLKPPPTDLWRDTGSVCRAIADSNASVIAQARCLQFENGYALQCSTKTLYTHWTYVDGCPSPEYALMGCTAYSEVGFRGYYGAGDAAAAICNGISGDSTMRDSVGRYLKTYTGRICCALNGGISQPWIPAKNIGPQFDTLDYDDGDYAVKTNWLLYAFLSVVFVFLSVFICRSVYGFAVSAKRFKFDHITPVKATDSDNDSDHEINGLL